MSQENQQQSSSQPQASAESSQSAQEQPFEQAQSSSASPQGEIAQFDLEDMVEIQLQEAPTEIIEFYSTEDS